MMRRRAFTVTGLAWLVWSVTAPAIYGQPTESGVRARSIGEGLWLVESDTDWNGTRVTANGLIVTSSEGVLVVDTPWTEEQTRYLLDWIATEIGLPVRYLVVTHAHQDRIGGIAAAHERDVATVGFEGTSELARDLGYAPPEITFADTLDLDLGGETVRLLYPGPGHSPDNMVLWLENRRLLYGGCLIKSLSSRGLGYTGDADVEAWPASLVRLQDLVAEPAIVIPGHGDTGGAELIQHTLDLLARHGKTSPR